MFDLTMWWLRQCLMRLCMWLFIAGSLLCVGGAVWQAFGDEPAPVDSIVITGLDVSSSINAVETQLQIDGVAQALRSPAVLRAIQAGRHGRVAFCVFVWADGAYPVVLSWRAIASQADADAAAAEIQGRLTSIIGAEAASIGTLTNLSGALDHARELLTGAPFRAERRLVNIIGNGEDNVGVGPEAARAALLGMGATINGVVVGGDPAVMLYYRSQVIGGRGAFVLSADKAETLAQDFTMKFVNEIAMR